MCCNGALYSRARVEPGEGSRVSGAGLDLVDIKDNRYFQLPCHLERDGLCSIYETRFTICRSFRCALLRRTNSGDIPLNQAKAIVAKARALLAAVAVTDPGAVTYVDRKRRRSELAADMALAAAKDRASLGERLVRMIALDEFLDRHFRNKKIQADGETVG